MDLHAFLFWVIGGLTAACAIATVVTHNIVRCATWLLFTLAGTSGLFFLIGADLVGAVQLLVYVGGTLVLVVFGVMLTAQGPFITMRTSSAEWGVSAAAGVAMFALLVLSFLVGKVQLNPQGKNEPNVAFAPDRNLSRDPAKSAYTMIIGQGFAGVGVGPAHRDPNYRPVPKDDKRATEEPPLGEKDAVGAPEKGDEKPPVAKKAEIADLDDNLKKLTSKDVPVKDEGAKGEAPKAEPKHGVKHAENHADKHGDSAESAQIEPASVVRANYLLPFEIVSVHLLVVLVGAAYLARAKRRETREEAVS